jgi:branched-chain amino acid transport system substrate-binding protein
MRLTMTAVTLVALVCATALGTASAAAQISDDVVKLGVLDDMSGPYAENSGPGDVLAVQMAAADFGGKVLGKPIEVISGDLENKVDVGLSIARQWYDDDKVDAIFGIGNSAVALAVQKLALDKDRIDISTVAATEDLTGKACSPNGAQWVYDTYSLSKGAVNAVLKQGGKSWYFITADYAFGHSLEANATAFVKAGGGTVLGSAHHPVGTQDFSSFVLQAQGSGAQVIGIANAGADTINALKQASEFGLTQGGQRLVGLLVQDTEVHALGLKTAQGLQFVEAFYWDQNDETRAFAKRFWAKHGAPPTMVQAGTYSAALHYLKAVAAAGTDEAKAVMAKMKAMPINDFMTKNGRIREDGRVIRDMYLMQAKKPSESTGEWDLLKVVATIPGDEAFRPLSESQCPLVKH